MVIVELSIMPLGTGSPSIHDNIARAIKVLDTEKDVKYELTAMGTIMEGDLDRLLLLAGKMHQAAFSDSTLRVVTNIRIDDRMDKATSIDDRIKSVKKAVQEV